MISRKKIFILLTLLLFHSLLYSQKKYKVEIVGTGQSYLDEISKFVQFNFISNEDSVGEKIKNKISNYLIGEGYIYLKISNYEIYSDDSLELKLKFNVNEGKKYVIKDFVLDDSFFENSDELERLKNSFNNLPFNDFNVGKIAEALLERYESYGYIFSGIKLIGFSKISEDDKQVDVKLNFSIEKNKKSIIAKIVTEGNSHTDSEVIIRESRIEEGDIYNYLIGDKIINRLRRLNIFSSIKEPEFYFNHNDEGILKLIVTEGNTNSFDGVIGYVPSNRPAEKGYLTGLINISLRNLFGTLRALSFRWQKLNRNSQDLEINYFEPWFLGLPINLYPGFFQRKQDSTYIQRNVSLKTEFNFSETFSINASFFSSRVIPSEGITASTLRNSSSISIGAGLKYDTRDDYFSPYDGLLFKTEYHFIRKNIFGGTVQNNLTTDLKKILGDFEYYQPTFRNQLLMIGLHGRELRGNDFDISDLFRFGGTNTLRGYEENQFGGSRLLWLNAEYRLMLGARNFVFVFSDVGYYFRNIMNEEISNIKVGYGLGIAIESPLGLLKINYALGEGDSISNGKIHFGIINAF